VDIVSDTVVIPTYADSLMIFLIEQDESNLDRFVEVSATVLKERYKKALDAREAAKVLKKSI
jgi:hypothetical protein